MSLPVPSGPISGPYFKPPVGPYLGPHVGSIGSVSTVHIIIPGSKLISLLYANEVVIGMGVSSIDALLLGFVSLCGCVIFHFKHA